MPSVTEIMQVAERWDMQRWIAKVGKAEADRVGQEAKVLGTKVHSTAEAEASAFNKGSAVYHLEEMQPFANAVRGFLEEWVSEVIHTELSLASERLRFGGTMDLYCRLKDDSYAICDYKTSSNGISRNHGMQLCAYGLLLRENGYSVNRRLGVRLRKDSPGKWSVREFENHQEDYEGWMGTVALWHWQNARKMEKLLKEHSA